MKQSLLDIDPNEQVLHEIKKHPFGIYQIIAVTVLIILAVFASLFFAIKYGEDFGLDGAESAMMAIFSLVALGVLVGSYIAITIYKANELIITNENIIQIIQVSLFDRKISQLSLAKIQDVSADQSGLLPNLFGFGTITIETAGEASNFNFTYSPEPNHNAKRIIEAYEGFVKSHSTGHNQTPVSPLKDI